MPDENAPYTVDDYEADAFKILQSTDDYDNGVAQLKDLYSKTEDKEAAKDILATYADDLFYKTKQKPFTLDELITTAPYKPDQMAGETDLEKINNWHTANTEDVLTSDDPNVIAESKVLKKSYDNITSEMRRDVLSEPVTNTWTWAKDKTNRFLEGATHSLGTLVGNNDIGEYFHERTSRESDEGLAGAVASAAGGFAAPLVAGVGGTLATGNPAIGGVAAFAALAAEGAGMVRGAYETAIEETKDPERALLAASLNAAGQAVQMIPIAKGAAKVIENVGARTATQALAGALDAQKASWGNVALATVAGGLAGTAGNTLAQIGNNIGTDSNGDITTGGMNAFLINGTLVGAFHGADALLTNYSIEHAKNMLKRAETELNKPPPKPPEVKPLDPTQPYTEAADVTPPTHAGDPEFVRDADGNLMEVPRGETTVEDVRAAQKDDIAAYQAYVDETPPEPQGKWTKETGEEVRVTPEEDVDISYAVPDLSSNTPTPVRAPVKAETGVKAKSGKNTVIFSEKEKYNESIARLDRIIDQKTTELHSLTTFDDNLNIIPKPGKEAQVKELEDALEGYRETRKKWDDELTVILKEEAGETVSKANTEVADLPPNAVLIGEGGEGKVNPFVSYIFGKLGGVFETRRNIMNGAVASFLPDKTVIRILRSLGSFPEKLQKTLAHEAAHFFDGILNDAFSKDGKLQEVVEKFKGLKGLIDSTMKDNVDFTLKANELSIRWRPGWDGSDPIEVKTLQDKFNKYRASPKEVFADVVSAIINDPEWVRTVDNGKFKSIYDAFEERLVKNPKLNEFWTMLRKFETDPEAITHFNMEATKVGRQKQFDIRNKVEEKKDEMKGFKHQLKRSLEDAHQRFINRSFMARRIAMRSAAAIRDVAMEHYNTVQRDGSLGDFLKLNVNDPTQRLFTKLLGAGIDPNDWAFYEGRNHLLNDVTNTMKRIEEDPEKFRKAGIIIRDFLLEDPKTPKDWVHGIFDDALAKGTSKDLSDAFSKINLIGDISSLQLETFLNQYSTKDPNRNAKALEDFNRAVGNLNKRKESASISELRSKIDKLKTKGKDAVSSEMKKALQDIVAPNAFAARRYLLNAGGVTVLDAANDIQNLKSILEKQAPGKFKALQDISKEFHEILSRTLPVIEKSGMFTPELIERIKNNADNYVTTTVLKYFEGDDSISPNIRSAIGSLSETGNEIASTLIKNNHITAAAYRQNSINSLVKLADMVEGQVSQVKLKFGENIFDKRNELSRSDPEHSYMITYENGKPTLNKITGGKHWENTFKSVSSIGVPALDMFLNLSDSFNKILRTKLFKTAFSPAFALRSKLFDRSIEAIMSDALDITFGLPLHSNGKLREIDAQTKVEIKHYQATGELTGNLKKVIDLDGAALHLSRIQEEGIDPFTSIADATYELFGNKTPKEDHILEKLGAGTEKVLGKIGFDYFRKMTEFDELRTKVNGFTIGKEMLGMGDAEAAVFAREKFGIGDPRGGGRAAPLINRMFLFGAANVAGLRALGSLVVDMPKTALHQGLLRIVLPKVLLSGVAMSAMLKAVSSDEDAKKYELLYGMVGQNEKVSTNVIVLGAQDGKGNFHNFFDIKLADIKPDWKPWYLRLPQSREVTAVSKVFWPMINDLIDGEFGKAKSESIAGVASVVSSGVQPVLQYMTNIGQMVMGQNPTDFFRQKGIFSNDINEAGSVLDKSWAYTRYFGAQQFPALAPYNPFQSATKAEGIGENIIKNAPVVGPMIRSVVGVGNYGLIEQGKALDDAKTNLKAEIRLSTDDDTRELLNMHRAAQAQLATAGKKGRAALGIVGRKDVYLQSWYSKTWEYAEHQLEAARAKGDDVRYNYILKHLAQSSAGTLAHVSQMKSEASDSD